MSKDLVVSLGMLLLALCLSRCYSRRRFPFPPGPSFTQVNASNLAKQPWLVLQRWSLKYGPLFSYCTFNKRTIVINSTKVALDLLEARSSIYSDRLPNWMADELAGRKLNVVSISPSHPRFKIYRRLLRSGLSARVCKDYLPIQMDELHKFVEELRSNPEDLGSIIKQSATATVLKVVYGYALDGPEDGFYKILNDHMDAYADLTTPGRWLVESFPFLRFIPEWVPGAYFKKHARKSKGPLSLLDEEPFRWTQSQIRTGEHADSFTSKLLLQETPFIDPAEKEDAVKWVSAALFVGGAETTASLMSTFFYIMMSYPSVQKKAREEIERVTRENRMPTADDYDSMPYVKAVIKELCRWGPPAPLGVGHCVTTDDVYEGFFIQKGTEVIANIWAMAHDQETYPDPYVFNPDRHLGENPHPDPYKFVFGFGRRRCPGIHLAETSLFLSITHVLANFEISKPKNTSAHDIDSSPKWTTGIVTHLEPLACQIKPRSKD